MEHSVNIGTDTGTNEELWFSFSVRKSDYPRCVRVMVSVNRRKPEHKGWESHVMYHDYCKVPYRYQPKRITDKFIREVYDDHIKEFDSYVAEARCHYRCALGDKFVPSV